MSAGDRDDSLQDELAAGIVGVTSYAVPAPVRREFAPWHRPRKQFVREFQWAHQVRKLLAEIDHADGVLRYLGLPGSDLLDIRYLHDTACLEHKRRLRFLGFNAGAKPGTSEHTSMSISLDEVYKLVQVDALSEVIPDDILRLGNESSIAWQKATEAGPYDVVNLDLCDGIASRRPNGIDDTHYEMIAGLLGIQATRKAEWLLLLTTRVGNGFVDQQTAEILRERYADTYASCDSFAELARASLGCADENDIARVWATCDGQLQITICGLLRWMLEIVSSAPIRSSIELKSAMGYRVVDKSECVDMLSLAIRFRPKLAPLPDPSGLAARSLTRLDPCPMMLSVARRGLKLVDTDSALSENDRLREQMILDSESLLTLARYAPGTYREWLNQHASGES